MNDNLLVACQNRLGSVRAAADAAKRVGDTVVFDDLCSVIWHLEAELLLERRRRAWTI